MVSSHTFAERLYNCTSFKQEKNYGNIIRNINLESIKLYRSSSENNRDTSFFSILYEKFSKRTNSLREILKLDKESMEDILISYAENISNFFHRFDIDNSNSNYTYRHKVNGYILGTTVINNKVYNIDISYRNSVDTFYHLYYYKLNFFLYNKTTDQANDSIVYIVESNTMYLIKYDSKDYTINRGFLDYNINNRTVRPSHQCLYCSVKHCKPRLITNIDRFIA